MKVGEIKPLYNSEYIHIQLYKADRETFESYLFTPPKDIYGPDAEV